MTHDPAHSPVAFIAIHAGAGYHSPHNQESLRALIEKAAAKALREAECVQDAVRIALVMLEQSPLTNSGHGSCLTENGRVECEASVMVGNGAFAAVGAVAGVENPINVAYEMCKERNERGLIKELGRVRPLVLVGSGAYEFALSRHLPVASADEISTYQVTEETHAKWRRYSEAIASYTSASDAKRAKIDRLSFHPQALGEPQQDGTTTEQQFSHGLVCTNDGGSDNDNQKDGDSETANQHAHQQSQFQPPSDSDCGAALPLPEAQHGTIGAIACDANGHVAAASSSGGIWMKSPGRLGCAAMMGCGCYAEDSDDSGSPSVAASLSGCGEDIMEQLMAVRACDAMKVKSELDHSPHASTDINRDGSDPTSMKSIMKKLIVKKVLHSQQLNARTKKRTYNDSGSSDTLREDDGLSTGIIALKAQANIDGSNALRLAFCFAHTAPHFAVGMASLSDSHDGVATQSWMSIQNSDQRQLNDMVIEERSIHITLPVSSVSKSPSPSMSSAGTSPSPLPHSRSPSPSHLSSSPRQRE